MRVSPGAPVYCFTDGVVERLDQSIDERLGQPCLPATLGYAVTILGSWRSTVSICRAGEGLTPIAITGVSSYDWTSPSLNRSGGLRFAY
jgi:hypothetical protein